VAFGEYGEKCQQQVKMVTRPKQKGFDDPMFGMGCDGNEVRDITPDLIAAPIGDFDAGSPDGALNVRGRIRSFCSDQHGADPHSSENTI
jgi:hypothetical protein